MIILGTPKYRDGYFMADGDLAFVLHQAGFIPKYLDDDDVLYFKLNKKLSKKLSELGIEL